MTGPKVRVWRFCQVGPREYRRLSRRIVEDVVDYVRLLVVPERVLFRATGAKQQNKQSRSKGGHE